MTFEADFPFHELLRMSAGAFPAGAVWAVTCGSALALQGLKYNPSDLDFFSGSKDSYGLFDSLARIGLDVVFPMAWRESEMYGSHWGRLRSAGGVEVDVVGDMSVTRDGRRYEWGASHPCWPRRNWIGVCNLTCPVFSMEDLLVLYVALPDEAAKVGLIVEALRARGCDHAYLRQLLSPEIIDQWGLRGLIDG